MVEDAHKYAIENAKSEDERLVFEYCRLSLKRSVLMPIKERFEMFILSRKILKVFYQQRDKIQWIGGGKVMKIGEVVNISNRKGKYVLVGIDNNKDSGSMCYDRTYSVIPLEKLENVEYLKKDHVDIENIEVRGVHTTPEIIVDVSEKPFTLIEEIRSKVSR